jgi:hypothetical protein
VQQWGVDLGFSCSASGVGGPILANAEMELARRWHDVHETKRAAVIFAIVPDGEDHEAAVRGRTFK